MWKSFIGTTDHPHWTEILGAQLGREVDRDDADRRAPTGQPGRARGVAGAAGGGDADRVGRARPACRSPSRRRHLATGCTVTSGGSACIDRFAAVHTGDEVARTKPSPELYSLAVTSLGVAPAAAVAIEDSVNGCVAAKAAGMAVVAVPVDPHADMDFPMADLVVGSVADLDLSRLDALVG